MSYKLPLALKNGVSGASSGNLNLPTGIYQAHGQQNHGGVLQPYDIVNDYIVQGFLTPTGASLSGTMSTAAFSGSGTNQAIAIVLGHRVYKSAGDSSLTFTYTASRDTYDDLNYDGTITHVSVTNGAGAPAVTANSLRLQKVVTNATAITTVTQLANVTPQVKGRYTSSLQAITLAGGLTLAHGLISRPQLVWYEFQCTVANNGYSIGDVLAGYRDANGNGNAPALEVWADATNLNIRFSSAGITILNKTTGANSTLTIGSWNVRFFAEL